MSELLKNKSYGVMRKDIENGLYNDNLNLMSWIFYSECKLCGIYKIQNIVNNMGYIGGSSNIQQRFSQHILKGINKKYVKV